MVKEESSRVACNNKSIIEPIRVVGRKRFGSPFHMTGKRVQTGASKCYRICRVNGVGNLATDRSINIVNTIGLFNKRMRILVDGITILRLKDTIEFEQSPT